MKEIVHLVNNSSKPLFKSSARLMTEIFTVSRLKYKPDLIHMTSVCPLPEFPSQFNLSFDEVSLLRAEQLWKNADNNHLNILWSGGIDSTCALVALILTRPASSKIVVYCNLNSMMENRALYLMLLKLNYIEFKNSSVISETNPMKLITGEMGDQVFGSDHIISISSSLGFNEIYSPFEKIIPLLFKNRGGESGDILYEKYKPIVDEAPFKIKTAFDFVWWWNFTQKWQCIKFHQKSLLPPCVVPVHFFEDDQFQFWSVFNHQLKIGNSMDTYKMPAKELIYSFDKNNSYQQNKKKFASPLGNTRYFYVLFKDGSTINTFEECTQLINSLSTGIPW